MRTVGRSLGLGGLLLAIVGCSPSLPLDRFPSGMEVDLVLHAEESGVFMEGCQAVIVSITEQSAARIGQQELGPDWRATPIDDANVRLTAMDALGGCEADARTVAPGLEAAIRRPGAFYRLVNHGEGMAVIVPGARMAGWFYVG